jgi:hypothetical protein
MKRITLLLMVVALWTVMHLPAEAQVPYVTYYQPVTVYHPAPVVYQSYYAPAPAPVLVAAPVAAYQPVTRVRTRYRPLLGGTVTRSRSFYAPSPVVYAY